MKMLKNLNLILDRLNLWRLTNKKTEKEINLIKGKIIFARQVKLITNSTFKRVWKLILRIENNQNINIK